MRPEVAEADRKSKYIGAKRGRGRGVDATSLAGVSYHGIVRRFRTRYRDARGKRKVFGSFASQEEAARARDAKIQELGLESKNKLNKVDAAGRLIEKPSKP